MGTTGNSSFYQLVNQRGVIYIKKIITYGTFDLFHIGHLNLLKRAKQLGDYLMVGVSTDEFNELKGKKSFIHYQERKEIVEAIRCVDEVIPEKNWEQKARDITENNIDILVMGDDWNGVFDDLSCKVVYLPRTPGISTSKIKEQLKDNIIPDQSIHLQDYTLDQKRKMLNAINKLQEQIPDYDFYLSFGTLLGCIRENGLINHDKDIDISYMCKTHTAKEVEQETIELYKRLNEKGLLENYRKREDDVAKGLWGAGANGIIDTIEMPKLQCQIVIDGVRLDTWTDWIDEQGNFYNSIRGNLGKADNYLPLKEASMYDIKLKIPSNAEMMLEDIYGEWKIPGIGKGPKPEKDYLGIWLGEIM